MSVTIFRFREFASTPSPRTGPSPFPDLRWTDKEQLWTLMWKKERGMYVRMSGLEVLDRHPLMSPKVRTVVLDWLMEVCEAYGLHRESFYLAVDFFDRYLGATVKTSKYLVQLIGL